MAHLTIPNFNIPYTGHAIAPIGLMRKENSICFLTSPKSASQFKGFFVEEIDPYFRRTEELDACPVTLREAPYWVRDVVVNKGFSDLINQDSAMKADITKLIIQIQNSISGVGLSTTDVMNFISFPYFLYTEGETVESFHAHLKRMHTYLDWIQQHISAFGGDDGMDLSFYESYLAARSVILQAFEERAHILLLMDFDIPFLPPEIKTLTFLKHITLDNNALNEFPKEILGFKDLKGIYMRGNRLTRVPKELTKLKSLVLADFKDNLINADAFVPRGVIAIGDYKYTLEHSIQQSEQNPPAEVKVPRHSSYSKSSAY
ncbi:MAG: leucine-rich repeat domain-containing protein [Alphaproteobacteria bacterium]|nr:leucine-rich repeat domain-containing protein [Alphaproteobacteria bacterium]MBP9877864.1 leucine-rich repeat domain-containing protein [Alphaproteobacteria bacterium]